MRVRKRVGGEKGGERRERQGWDGEEDIWRRYIHVYNRMTLQNEFGYDEKNGN